MASSISRKQGLRCKFPHPSREGECGELLMEVRDGKLGIACRRSGGEHFTPLSVLLVRLKEVEGLPPQKNDNEQGETMAVVTEKKETWIDERGKKVYITPFFPHIYQDEEVVSAWATQFFPFEEFFEIGIHLGKGEYEQFVNTFMRLCAAAGKVGGFARASIIQQLDAAFWVITDLVHFEYFREKWIKGTLIIFPTDKLFEKIHHSINRNKKLLTALDEVRINPPS